MVFGELFRSKIMQVLYKKDLKTVNHDNSNACTVIEYKIDKDNQINSAIITINGRYPHQGRAINQKCKEIVYIYNGSGKIVIEDKEVLLNIGDAVLIAPGEKCYWEGNMSAFVSCTPAWHPEQHILVD
jgi:mannose-6-phosphate isomerase-like protein (cupin superfamily)